MHTIFSIRATPRPALTPRPPADPGPGPGRGTEGGGPRARGARDGDGSAPAPKIQKKFAIHHDVAILSHVTPWRIIHAVANCHQVTDVTTWRTVTTWIQWVGMIRTLQCKVCGHEWVPAGEKDPERCANKACRSVKWRDGVDRRSDRAKTGQGNANDTENNPVAVTTPAPAPPKVEASVVAEKPQKNSALREPSGEPVPVGPAVVRGKGGRVYGPATKVGPAKTEADTREYDTEFFD